MNKVNIVHRALTSEEIKQMNTGFDALYHKEEILIESSEKFSCVALNEGNFIGCGSGLAYKNGAHYSGWFYLSDLFVEKNYRSMGTGAQLLRAFEEKLVAIGVKHIWLWTSGDKSLKFYNRQGYKEFTAFENWYSDGSSRIGLRKDFE